MRRSLFVKATKIARDRPSELRKRKKGRINDEHTFEKKKASHIPRKSERMSHELFRMD